MMMGGRPDGHLQIRLVVAQYHCQPRSIKVKTMTASTVLIETQIPTDVYMTLQAKGLFRKTLADKAQRLLALQLYEDRSLSLGKAARLAGMSYWNFLDFLSENEVAVINFGDEELAAEIAAVEQLQEALN